MSDFNSEVKAVTQSLDSIALSLSQHSITVRVNATPAPILGTPGHIPWQPLSTAEANRIGNTQSGILGDATISPNRIEPSLAEFSSQITALSTRLKNALAAATALTVAPTITSVSPPSGPAGTVITITGTGFGDSPTGAVVWISGVAAHPNSWSSTKITATVPHGVAKGDVSITTTGGKSTGTFAFTSDYVPPVPPAKEAPVIRAIPGPPFADLEPIVDARPGTAEFAEQSTRHRAWEERQHPTKVSAEPIGTTGTTPVKE